MKDRLFHVNRHTFFVIFAVFAIIVSGCSAKMAKKGQVTRQDASAKKKAMDLFIEGKVAEAKDDYAIAITSYIEAFQYDPASDEIAHAVARAFSKMRKPMSARLYARKAVELNPDKAENWRILQQIEQITGNIENAAEALEKYMQIKPDIEYYDVLWLSRYYFDLDRDDEGKDLLTRAAKTGTRTASELSDTADILAERGYVEDAIAIYKQLVERDPLDALAWINLGELYERDRNWGLARKTYIEGLDKNPDSMDIMVMVGNLCLFENDWECAIVYFEMANKTQVGVSKIRKTLCALYFYSGREDDALKAIEDMKESGDDDATFYFSLGKAMSFLERDDDAIRYYKDGFKKGISEIPEDELYSAYGGFASALVRNGRHEDAIDLVRNDAGAQLQDRTGLKMLEASIYMDMKRYDDAISIYDWVLSSNPDNIRFIFQLGQAYNTAGRYDEAEKVLLTVPDVDPDNIDYLIQLSLVYDFSGQFKKAEKALLTVIDAEPDHALALNNLAYMYIENDKNLSKATKMVVRALTIEPRNGAYYDTLGWAYFKRGKFEEAKTNIESALKYENTPDRGVIYDHYGDILVELGLNREAADAYKAAIDLGESAENIQPKLKKLEQ